MKTQYFTLKEVKLNNNCPECFSREGLQLTFKQKIVENVFYKAITLETKHSLYCNVCGNDIFPVSWTDDIEQVFAYQQRAATPKPKSIKLKKLAWILIVTDIIIVAVIIMYSLGIFNS